MEVLDNTGLPLEGYTGRPRGDDILRAYHEIDRENVTVMLPNLDRAVKRQEKLDTPIPATPTFPESSTSRVWTDTCMRLSDREAILEHI